MRKLFKKLWNRRKIKRRYSGAKFVASLPDVPAAVNDYIYIIGNETSAKWAVFECPCSAGHQLTVNLMKSASPRWALNYNRGEVSLFPSIVVTDHPCSSHFWLENNRVYEAYFE